MDVQLDKMIIYTRDIWMTDGDVIVVEEDEFSAMLSMQTCSTGGLIQFMSNNKFMLEMMQEILCSISTI